MRSFIFIPLALLVCAIFLSAFSKANADSAIIEGKISRLFDGRTVLIDGEYPRITLVAGEIGPRLSNGAAILGFESLKVGQDISCRRVETDAYGNVTAVCKTVTGDRDSPVMIAE